MFNIYFLLAVNPILFTENLEPIFNLSQILSSHFYAIKKYVFRKKRLHYVSCNNGEQGEVLCKISNHWDNHKTTNKYIV